MELSQYKDGFQEYRAFLREYLLPLLGVSHNNNLKSYTAPHPAKSDVIRQEGNQLIFSTYTDDVAILEMPYILPDDVMAVGKNVIQMFFAVSKYYMSEPRSTKLDYKANDIYELNVKLAVQKGICNWCAGENNRKFHELLQILEQWSVQTYEGKKVTFGFVFNPNAESAFFEAGNGTWFDFLADDYAATLSDCIHSVIEIDRNCVFSRYLSVSDGGHVSKYNLGSLLPYRFANVIQKYVVGNAVGIFLLNNGDIVLSKDQSIKFIKRNLRWLNMSFPAFSTAVKAKFTRGTVSDTLLKQVYASTLDVSFSHSGGIIAVVRDIKWLIECSNENDKSSNALPILNPCDNLLDTSSLDDISLKMDAVQHASRQKNLDAKERKKRLLKRQAISCLVAEKKFPSIDRKLRAELIAMDGACIVDLRGNVCAIGAIIQNDSGSSGGGRNAAAKKLSRYGLAVKISTDGYIELFVDGDRVYSVK